ncbi:MAG TPA: ABC transporter permease [Polyangiaceae bacterium]|nr:ABC transporter permease [Polyangiaceae bacterium]
MNPLQTFRIAVRAIVRNKMRSFLTVLGIVIGVAAVIAMMAVGAGAKARIESAFASMGTNLLVILPGSTTSGGMQGGFGSQPTLTWDDLTAIQRQVPSVRLAAPLLRANSPIIGESGNWMTSVNGTSPEYFDIRSWGTSAGEPLRQADLDAQNKVVVLGQTVVEKLYGSSVNPVGQVVRIRNIPFVVVGVLEKKGQSATGQDYDDMVFIPYTVFARKIQGGLGKYLSGTIYVSATSGDTVARAQEDISALLRERHRLPGADDDFSIRNLSELAGAQAAGTETMTSLLASVAAVSLLVGGIGIMNIMLVSVTERTREIGIRMAIGAKPRQILLQFLIEAVTLSVAGGLVGVALGVGVSEWIAAKFGWATAVDPNVVAVAVAFSAFVGIAFGLYPARKASQLDPIDALRYE